MNVLVTGAGGFVGSHLVRALLKSGYRTRGTMRDTSARPHDNNNRGVDWISLDLSRADNDFSNILKDIDIIVHLAARVHQIGEGKDNTEPYRILNVEGTRLLLANAKKFGIKRFIFLSTIKVAGEGSAGTKGAVDDNYSEDSRPDPRDAYAASKYAAEQIVQQNCNKTDMEYVIIRPPLVYGPGVKGNFLSLLRAVHRHYPLPFSMVRNKRSLIYVENLCDAIMKCIEHKDAANNVFHICDDTVSTASLIKNIAACMGINAFLLPVPLVLLRTMARITGRKDSIDKLTESLVVDCSKIRKLLSWSPYSSMEEAMETTVKWYLDRTD